MLQFRLGRWSPGEEGTEAETMECVRPETKSPSPRRTDDIGLLLLQTLVAENGPQIMTLAELSLLAYVVARANGEGEKADT